MCDVTAQRSILSSLRLFGNKDTFNIRFLSIVINHMLIVCGIGDGYIIPTEAPE